MSIEIISIDGKKYEDKSQNIKLDKNTDMKTTKGPNGEEVHIDRRKTELGRVNLIYFCEQEGITTIPFLDHKIKFRYCKSIESISQTTLPSHQTPET
jgi:hypothetical protein